MVTDNLPTGYHLRESSPPARRVNDKLFWSLGTLAPLETRSIRLSLEPTAFAAPFRSHAVEVTYQGQITSQRNLPVCPAALSLNVRVPQALVVGVPAQLQILVRNSGAIPAAEVGLQTLLLNGLSSNQGTDLEASLGTLGPGQERVVPLAVMATRGGELRARITAQGQGAEPVTRDVVLTADDQRLTVAPGGPTRLPEQFSGLFELTVRNDQAAVARQVSLTVQLPPGLAFVRASEGGAYNARNHAVSWPVGDLQPGEHRTLAWNGIGVKAGEQECKVQLQSSGGACREVRWTTTILPGAGPVAPVGGWGDTGVRVLEAGASSDLQPKD